MYKNDLVVLASAIIISVSGIAINLTKVSDRPKAHINVDKYTLFWFRILVPLSLITSLILSFSRMGQINIPLTAWYTGLFLIIFGITFRWIAIATLGKLFTVDIGISSNHRLITTGIYRHIRHPSYTGLLIYYLGLGIIMCNWISLCLLIILPTFAVINRIGVEENVLEDYFKEQYNLYQKKSWRLFPLIY